MNRDFRLYLEMVARQLGSPEKGFGGRRRWLELLGRSFTEEYPVLRSKVDLHLSFDGRVVPVRLYRPEADGRLPLLIFCHGGGWVAGSIESHDFQAASISAATSSVVASVDYRLAPENPYPAAVDDCCDTLNWLLARHEIFGIDRDFTGAVADSAGAQIVVACALRSLRAGTCPLRLLALLYPALDDRRQTDSYRLFEQDPLLSKADMEEFWQAYLGGKDADDLVAPARAQDLAGLPSTIILTAEVDPLRDEGELFAKQLSSQSVPVKLKRALGLGHGFLRARTTCQSAQNEFDWFCEAIRDALRDTRRNERNSTLDQT
ncbi:MAG: alpha/beta hydrolase [Rhizobiaceae bacterium]